MAYFSILNRESLYLPYFLMKKFYEATIERYYY